MSADAAGNPVVWDAPPGGNDGITVSFGPACWYSDAGHRYQAMTVSLQAAQPQAVEATLFFNHTCDPADGTDNLNDTGGTFPSGTWTVWFIHHPDNPATSAIWWVGSHYSGCIDYGAAPGC